MFDGLEEYSINCLDNVYNNSLLNISSQRSDHKKLNLKKDTKEWSKLCDENKLICTKPFTKYYKFNVVLWGS